MSTLSTSLNTSSSALSDDPSDDPLAALERVGDATEWKQEVNARLAAHRSRRIRKGEDHPTLPGIDAGGPSERRSLASSVAARVAARYAAAPTYSEMLAAEAQNVATAAAAAAKAAHQAHTAAQAILTGLDIRPLDFSPLDGRPAAIQPAEAHTQDPAPSGDANSWAPRRGSENRAPGNRVTEKRAIDRRSAEGRSTEPRSDPANQTRRQPWQDALPAESATPQALTPQSLTPQNRAVGTMVSTPSAELTPSEGSRLRITLADGAELAVAEIEEQYEAPEPLPANLIQFPRELVAARKARPRLEEGPLRDEHSAGSEKAQLRIFEVEPESISTVPRVEPTQTEWSSIRLGAHPAYIGDRPPQQPTSDAQRDPARSAIPTHLLPAEAHNLELPLETAPLEDRCMAAVVDLALTTAAFLLYVLVFVACTTQPPSGKPAIIGLALSFLAVAVGYQLLFFSFAEGTPGMRYAKIALCTFDDENPTRSAMRKRIATLLLSLCPFGLGCAWVFFDDDHLSWHDRITRTYQRSYR